KLTYQQWRDEIKKLLDPKIDLFLKNLKRFLFEILPIFFDAYKMESENSLINYDILEEEYMSTSDGIVYTSNLRPYKISVVEESKPYENDCDIQICKAAKDIINYL
ncbi:6494_t:CDS:2, partial [Funneliformis caledonium]